MLDDRLRSPGWSIGESGLHFADLAPNLQQLVHPKAGPRTVKPAAKPSVLVQPATAAAKKSSANATKKAAPAKKAASKNATPDKTSPEKTTPEKTTPDKTAATTKATVPAKRATSKNEAAVADAPVTKKAAASRKSQAAEGAQVVEAAKVSTSTTAASSSTKAASPIKAASPVTAASPAKKAAAATKSVAAGSAKKAGKPAVAPAPDTKATPETTLAKSSTSDPLPAPTPARTTKRWFSPSSGQAKAADTKPPKYLIDKKWLEAQRALLYEERAKYTHNAEHLAAEAIALMADREPGDVQFDEESGEGDTLAVERDRDLALSAQARENVDEIDAALTRLDNGSYGICVASGEYIPQERLEALPQADKTVAAKTSIF